jgi:hypothetical protein
MMRVVYLFCWYGGVIGIFVYDFGILEFPMYVCCGFVLVELGFLD